MSFSKPFAVFTAALVLAGAAQAATLVDGATTGLYNAGIGRSLDLTNPYGGSYYKFPNREQGQDVEFTDAPDLSTASAALGGWLTDPENPGGTWSLAEVAIPFSWTRHHETAIIYTIDGGTTGLTNVIGSFGVDNGLHVWMNGSFVGGHIRPGDPVVGEWTVNFGDLAPGLNYLQILREDHGFTNGYFASVTGDAIAPVPLPASALLMIAGMGGFAAFRRRKSA